MLYLNFSENWTVNNNFIFKTKINFKIVDDLLQCTDLNIWRNVHGFWGWIYVDNDKLIIKVAVDIMRSFPIFYSIQHEDIFISDNAYWIQEHLPLSHLDKLSVNEFRTVGYVTGPDTLLHEIKQVQAGETITFSFNYMYHKWEALSTRYYQYKLAISTSHTYENYIYLLRTKLDEIFEYFLNYVNDRKIVIPLSGGYDSRLILLMLKKMKYDNIMTFTYGAKNNTESLMSKKIAESLGVEWLFVEYTNESWKKWYSLSSMRDYMKYAGNLTALPHFQDWPAVMKLKEDKKLSEDSVFAPGHCIETGQRVNEYPFVYDTNATFEDALEACIRLHYNHSSDWTKHKSENKNRIISRMDDFAAYISPGSFFDSFEQMERQVKYINNSVRVYEFWGYDWYTPLWDVSYQNFWSSIPISIKYNQELYLDCIAGLCKEQGILLGESKVNAGKQFNLKYYIANLCRKILPSTTYSLLRRKFKSKNDYARNTVYGCFTNSELKVHSDQGRLDTYSMFAYEYLKSIGIND